MSELLVYLGLFVVFLLARYAWRASVAAGKRYADEHPKAGTGHQTAYLYKAQFYDDGSPIRDNKDGSPRDAWDRYDDFDDDGDDGE